MTEGLCEARLKKQGHLSIEKLILVMKPLTFSAVLLARSCTSTICQMDAVNVLLWGPSLLLHVNLKGELGKQ